MPMPGHVVLRADLFEDADVTGTGRTLDEVMQEDDEETGTNWEVVVLQDGTVTELLIYV
jgi:hypothetical protein